MRYACETPHPSESSVVIVREESWCCVSLGNLSKACIPPTVCLFAEFDPALEHLGAFQQSSILGLELPIERVKYEIGQDIKFASRLLCRGIGKPPWIC
jgi:hypothetical protein